MDFNQNEQTNVLYIVLAVSVWQMNEAMSRDISELAWLWVCKLGEQGLIAIIDTGKVAIHNDIRAVE